MPALLVFGWGCFEGRDVRSAHPINGIGAARRGTIADAGHGQRDAQLIAIGFDFPGQLASRDARLMPVIDLGGRYSSLCQATYVLDVAARAACVRLQGTY
jgi:hypothetical protein